MPEGPGQLLTPCGWVQPVGSGSEVCALPGMGVLEDKEQRAWLAGCPVLLTLWTNTNTSACAQGCSFSSPWAVRGQQTGPILRGSLFETDTVLRICCTLPNLSGIQMTHFCKWSYFKSALALRKNGYQLKPRPCR